MSSGKVLLGLLAGAAVGATIGILFAPEKGSTTRSKITKKSDDYAEELEGKFNDFLARMTQQYEMVKDKAVHIVENGKVKAEKLESDIMAAAK